MNLYLKYRPKTFSEVIGQDHIKQTLINALRQNKVSHAYLFSGPRGTGKTSVARLLAKAVNCLNLKEGEPDNSCEICRAILEDRFMDMIEIDAASNRGIDEIRELREKVKFSPTLGKYKVFIIDECHMLTKEAFNALLKVLEEPPSHVIFVLATTEIHKVPLTIISRCQRFDFHKIPLKNIIQRLKEIAQKENLKIEEAALKFLAFLGEGSLRDSLSFLDQLMVFGEKEISVKNIQELFGVTERTTTIKFIQKLVNKDKRAALEIIKRVSESGYDLVIFAREICSLLRKILLIQCGEKEEELFDADIAFYQEMAKIISPKDLIRLIELFSPLDYQIKTSFLPSLPLELAVIEYIEENPKF